jgi:hypothetical protein
VKAGSKKINCEFHLRDAKLAEVKAGSKKNNCEFHLRDAKLPEVKAGSKKTTVNSISGMQSLNLCFVLKDPAGGE